MANQIGTLNEKSLHADLKKWYAQPGDQVEVKLDGYFIDLVRGDQLIEIQTRGFSAMKRKLQALTREHPVRLVHPIAQEKWLIKQDDDGQPQGKRRKSPKKGSVFNLFDELVSFPALMANPNFELEVLLIQEEEVKRFRGGKRRWWRKRWRTHERHLLEVVGAHRFNTPNALAKLLPDTLPNPFTTADLASALGKPRSLAQKMVYCLREMEAITPVGHKNRFVLYSKS